MASQTSAPDDTLASEVSSRGRWFGQYHHPMLASLLLVLYVGWLGRHFPDRETIGYLSLAFKGVLAVMGVVGLFLLADMREADHQAYLPLFAGLFCLSVAFTTDSAAELVRTSFWIKLIGERVLLVLGFAVVLRGLYLWSRHTLQINARLERLVRTDELTGVANRRQLMQALNQQVAIARRQPQGVFSAIMFDVDHFKQINDRHGHDQGDQVLKEVTRQVGSELRLEDTLARIGGEEFVVLLPATGLEGAALLAERLRACVQRTRIGALDPVSASFGVALYQPGESVDHFLKRLDVAVYQSKADGRDRVTVDASHQALSSRPERV